MSDDDAPKGGQDGDKSAEFKPITSQADLDRIIGDRVARERGRFADYDDLKAKADKFDAAEQASKTDLEKAVARAEAAEARAAGYEAKEQRATWATEIVKGSDVPAAALRGTTREELQEHFEILAPHFTKEAPKRRPTPPGKSSTDNDGEKGRAAAALRELRRG